MNNESRMRLFAGLWLVVVAITVVGSMALGARLSTSAMLLVIGVVPVAIALLRTPQTPVPVVSRSRT